MRQRIVSLVCRYVHYYSSMSVYGKKIVPLMCLFLLVGVYGHSQGAVDAVYAESDIEVKPAYPGGIDNFYRFIAKTMHYPATAFKNGIEGTVYVEFVIDATGNIAAESIVVKKGVHKSLDNEAVRVFNLSPAWSPGLLTAHGPPVATKMIVPITFRLK